MVETVLAVDALLLGGASGFALLAALLALRLPAAGAGADGRRGPALGTSMALAVASALAILRLLTAVAWLPVLGVQAALALATTLPLTAVLVVAASATGPRLRALAAGSAPDAGTARTPVLLAGGAAAATFTLWALEPSAPMAWAATAALLVAGAAVVRSPLPRRRPAAVTAPVIAPVTAPVTPDRLPAYPRPPLTAGRPVRVPAQGRSLAEAGARA